MLAYAAAIFILVTLVSMVLMTWLLPNRAQKRLQELQLPAEKTDWLKTAVGIASPLAKLSIPQGDWENSTIRIKFINAGIRSRNAPILFYAAKTVLPLLLAAAGYVGLEQVLFFELIGIIYLLVRGYKLSIAFYPKVNIYSYSVFTFLTF